MTLDHHQSIHLSHHLARNPSTLIPAVDALERKGLLRRGQDPDDRRRTPLSLTEAGRTLLVEVPFVDAGDPLAQGLQAMGQERVERLRTLLKELLGDLPGGPALLAQAETQVRMRARCPERREHRQDKPAI